MGLSLNEILLDGLTADPLNPPDGCIWYRKDLKEFRKQVDGVVKPFSLDSPELVSFAIDGTYFTTSSSFTQLKFNKLTPLASELKSDATVLKCVIKAEVFTEGNAVGELELYNLTDGTQVIESLIAIPNAVGFKVVESDEFTIDQGKTYRIRIRRVSGSGQDEVDIRSAYLKYNAE